MPDIKTLCRDLDAIRVAINALTNRIGALEMQSKVEQAFNAPSTAAPPPSSIPAAIPPPSPSPASSPSASSGDPKKEREGDLPEVVPDYLANLGRGRKSKSKGVEDHIDDLELDREISDARRQEAAVHAALNQLEENMSAMAKAERSITKIDDKIEKENEKQIKQEIKDEIDALKMEMKQQAQITKLESRDETADILAKIFGIRFLRKIMPEGMNPLFDLKSMSNNVRFVDRQLQNGINKSIAEKTAAGQMTQAEAGKAAGFMSGEAIGAQVGAGALIGLYIFENIPKIVALLRDSTDFLTGISDAMFDTKTGKFMAYLDSIVADLTSIKAGKKAFEDYAQASAAFGFDADVSEGMDIANRVRSATASDARIKEAGERWLKRQGQKKEVEMATDLIKGVAESALKSIGFK